MGGGFSIPEDALSQPDLVQDLQDEYEKQKAVLADEQALIVHLSAYYRSALDKYATKTGGATSAIAAAGGGEDVPQSSPLSSPLGAVVVGGVGGGVEVTPGEETDCEFLGHAVIEAERAHTGKGIWDCLVPWSHEDHDGVLKRAFADASKTDPNCHFLYSRFMVAKTAGKAVSAACGFKYPDFGVQRSKEGILAALMKHGAYEGPESAGAGWSNLSFFEAALPVDVEYDNTWMIEAVYTDTSHRRMGLSRRLLDAVYEQGRSTGCSRAMIVCSVGNEAAMKLYSACGFVLIGTGGSEECQLKLGYSGYHILVKDY